MTLVELLVVVVILATMVGAAVIRWRSDTPDQRLERAIDQFAARFSLECDGAVLNARPVVAVLTAEGYRFESLRAEAREERAPNSQGWPTGSTLHVASEGSASSATTHRIVCDASGAWTPFELSLSLQQDRIRLLGTADSRMVVER